MCPPFPVLCCGRLQDLVKVDWELYQNAFEGHYNATAKLPVQLEEASSYARYCLPLILYVPPPLPMQWAGCVSVGASA